MVSKITLKENNKLRKKYAIMRLLTKGKKKREASDPAIEAVKKEYPSPEYWAAFIMLD